MIFPQYFYFLSSVLVARTNVHPLAQFRNPDIILESSLPSLDLVHTTPCTFLSSVPVTLPDPAFCPFYLANSSSLLIGSWSLPCMRWKSQPVLAVYKTHQ